MSAAAVSAPAFVASLTVDPEHSITPNQLELLALYASGYSYDEIAGIKFFSYHGVRKSLTRAVERSGARNLTHLVAVAVEVGMLRRNSSGHYEPVQDLRVAGE